ncbi:MAG: nucleoside-diphosphate kinase [Candidatus Liptonbacteria bacterium RIFCSPHIGHO2_01_FULL_57_28]|uniref:Nucleoside diphosphate kinase n=1 Tax=Candidatus Liptonbacteria bacterium RIFCSPHIGHO2_01_FULL_57_28 TaxID=1798647 RepID=A0A1G2C9M3_9BACT|nr:MAG: nucleoside-diphosphate kinase [Candidatus Liptonbacteria bacterium RIFCSPHIGHO2_01_FULL_57_28]
MSHPREERTLIIVKPDAMQRSLLGEIIRRFEQKGLKIIAMKMMHLNKEILKDHYAKHIDKPFFDSLAGSMSYSPVVAMVLSGLNAISAARLILGPTKGYEADAGSIRGDLALSGQSNLVHASDPEEDPEMEIKRFFAENEIFAYKKVDFEVMYGEEERQQFGQ